MEEPHTLTDNAARQRYELQVEDDKAVVEYIKKPGIICLTHTLVPPKYEGRGIGSELVRGVLEDIRRQGLQVIPQCRFVARWILRHPEWEKIVFKKSVE